MLLLLHALSALAAPLQLVSAMADGNERLEVHYVLTPESWYPVEQGMAQPTLVYTLDGSVVERAAIRKQLGVHVLSRKPAYNDGQLSVSVQDPSGVYDSLQVGSWNGTALQIRILGPTRPSAVSGGSSTTSTVPRPSPTSSGSSTTSANTTRTTTTRTSTSANVDIDLQPEDVVAIATDALDMAQRIQANQQAKAANQGVAGGGASRAPLDPNDPLVAQCMAIDRNRVVKCHDTFAARPDAPAELQACAGFDVRGHQEECRTFVRKAPLPMRALIESCQQAFGTDVWGIRCLNVAKEASTPPEQDIQACGEHLEDPDARLACVARFREVAWSPAAVLPVCKAAYPEQVIECLAHIAGPFPEKPGLAQVCVDSMTGERGLDCMAMMRRHKSDPVPLVEACTAGFESEKDRFRCIEIARNPRVDAAKITGCLADKRPHKCIER